MYKTVRHGENSLQYTILPQTEEVLNNGKGKGRDYSPSIHVRRSRRKSTVKYVLLVIFGLIVALALAAVPLYIMNGALYARRHQQINPEATTSPPLAPAAREIVKSRKKELKITPDILCTLKSKLDLSTSTTTTTAAPTTVPPTAVTAKTTTTTWSISALKPWKASAFSTTIKTIPTEDTNEVPLIGTPSGSIRMLDRYMSAKPWEQDVIIRPTVAAEPVTIRDIFKYYSRSRVPAKTDDISTLKAIGDVLITTKAPSTLMPIATETVSTESSKFRDLKDTILSVDDDDEFKESLEVDEVFSLPPLNSEVVETDEVKVSKAADGWYGARWPFVDTSSYFQWTGYTPSDNLLLPLLVAALSSIALVLLLAIAVRRRKRGQADAIMQVATSEQNPDDNTNLLTAENPEETEE